MKLTQSVEGGVMDFDPFNVRVAADPSHNLGSFVELADYRAFRYLKIGASNTSAGKLQIAPAPKANHSNTSVPITAAGSFSVTVTPGATAGVLSEYDEGLAVVNAGPGIGQSYLISHNPAFNASTAFTLTLSDPISTAFTASTKLTLVHNQYNGSVEAAVQTRRGNGVPLVGVTAAYEAWAQTKGVAATLADQAIAVGSWIVPSASVAGAVIAISGTYATALVTGIVGQASVVAGVDTEYRPMVLTID
jgi:hypothetical protein